ncbi:Cell death protease [Blyttiomyces sp. JEL0837]|nr:Cell death protease [Blyttiomyces sp. JEL0837]
MHQRHDSTIRLSLITILAIIIEISTIYVSADSNSRPRKYPRSSFGTAKWTSTNANDYLVTNLPNETESLTKTMNGQWAGYVPFVIKQSGIKERNLLLSQLERVFNNIVNQNHLSFTYKTLRLNGGPGCSSLFGSFIENGPVKVLDNGSLVPNDYSWHKQANLLYIEQPVETGFSFTNGPPDMNETDASSNFYLFLDGFYQTFPETQSYDLFLTGESYAGVYIPYIAQELLGMGKFSTGQKVNLKGLGIGNGVYSTMIQESWASAIGDFDFLHEKQFFGNDTVALNKAGNAVEACRYATNANASRIPYQCDMFTYADEWISKKDPANFSCLNIYNIHTDCHYTDARENSLAVFLNDPRTQKALHVSDLAAQWNRTMGTTWEGCSDLVMQYMDDSGLPDTYEVMPKILQTGIPIILFEGDLDFICQYVNVERVLGNMTWFSKTGFDTPLPPKDPWTLPDGKQAGITTNSRGLTYIRIFNAGHMVPTDQPAAGYQVLNQLLSSSLFTPAKDGGISATGTSTVTGTVTTKGSGGVEQVGGIGFGFGWMVSVVVAVGLVAVF